MQENMLEKNELKNADVILNVIASAFKKIKDIYYENINVDEIYDVFINYIKESLENSEILCDFLAGKDTLNIDGVTKDYILKKEDTLLIDISVKYNGIWCDVTRTFFVGKPNNKQIHVFELIKESIKNGERVLKQNVNGRDVFQEVNAVFEKENKKLIHHAGHRIGSEPVMEPEFLDTCKEIVKEDMLIAIESGLYEEFGIRLENDYLITNEGYISLFEQYMPLEIEEYIL